MSAKLPVPVSQDRAGWPKISVIIPAFNEEAYIGRTIESLRAAAAHFESLGGPAVELLVVDNASTDDTATVAARLGARVVSEGEHNISKVRNAGARAAAHEILVFIDADTLVPRELFVRIAGAMREGACEGGAVDVAFRPERLAVRMYLAFCRVVGAIAGMAMGACQFCRRDVFDALGGYDERIYMAEDVDFMWRLRAAARRRGSMTHFIRDLQVIASSRRFDRWPLWRTVIMTHPLVILAFHRRKSAWRGWYERTEAPR